MQHDLSLDQQAADRAARQHGLITRKQALAIGFSAAQVKWRLTAGRWRLLGRGVYAITGSAGGPLQSTLAACLAGPTGTVASHRSAAALFGLSKHPGRPHITVPATASARTPGVTVHRSELDRHDRVSVGVIPCTGVGRTLSDCAAHMGQNQVNAMVDDALSRPLASVGAVRSALDRLSTRPGRKGLPRLASALEAWEDGITPGSPAEMRLLRRLAEWSFPPPARQHVVSVPQGRFKLDLAWPTRLVGLEYDGARSHTPRDLRADEARHAAITAAGWVLLRADKFDLAPSADRLRRELRRAFGPCAA